MLAPLSLLWIPLLDPPLMILRNLFKDILHPFYPKKWDPGDQKSQDITSDGKNILLLLNVAISPAYKSRLNWAKLLTSVTLLIFMRRSRVRLQNKESYTQSYLTITYRYLFWRLQKRSDVLKKKAGYTAPQSRTDGQGQGSDAQKLAIQNVWRGCTFLPTRPRRCCNLALLITQRHQSIRHDDEGLHVRGQSHHIPNSRLIRWCLVWWLTTRRKKPTTWLEAWTSR